MTRPKPRRPRGPAETWQPDTVAGREIEVLVPLHGDRDRTCRGSPDQRRQLEQFVDALLESLCDLGSTRLVFEDLRKLRLVDELRLLAPTATDALARCCDDRAAPVPPELWPAIIVDLGCARRVLAEQAARHRRHTRSTAPTAVAKALDLLRRSPAGTFPTLKSLAKAAGCSSPTLSKAGLGQTIGDLNRTARIDAVERGRSVTVATRGSLRKSPESHKSVG